jgi:tetratricopeptide (TPR) repeat protein
MAPPFRRLASRVSSALPLLSVALLGVTVAAAGPPPEDATAALARAVQLHQAGDLEGAITAYRESLRLGPTAEAGSNLGAALAALGRYQEAIEAYRGALALAPLDGRIRYNLALAYYKSADLPRAAEELEALHAKQPGDVRATLLLADCRLQLGEPAAVEALLRPLAATRPDDRAVAYMLGMALVRNGKVQEGQRLVETLLKDGDSAEAQYLVGSAAFMAGDYPQAVERFSSALQKNAKLPSLRSYYGRALLFTGDADGAERAFREALVESPNDYEANHYLASLLATRGRPKDARPFAEKALGLRPQSAEAKELVASLDSPGRAAAPAEPVSPLVGHPAPDVTLQGVDGRELQLSALRGRPLVLMVGSFTCPQLRHGAPEVSRLYERHKESARFLMAYIREAHPDGEAWQSTINRREGIRLPEARSLPERAEHAALCRRELKIPFEVALDGLDGKAEAAFSAFPSRVFVIDARGTVTFSSALDEESFRPEALEAALEATLVGAR